jgi:metal-responsive CopG/Arc/MetJ family transcriptional regulator
MTANETPISIRIPVELLARLDEEAKKQDRSRSNLVVLLIRRGLDGAVVEVPE